MAVNTGLTTTLEDSVAASSRNTVLRTSNGTIWVIASSFNAVPKLGYSLDDGSTWANAATAFPETVGQLISWKYCNDGYIYAVYIASSVIYTRRGTLNGGHTDISWSARTTVFSGSSGLLSLAVHEEGAGTMVHVIFSNGGLKHSSFLWGNTPGTPLVIDTSTQINTAIIDFYHTQANPTVVQSSTPHLFVQGGDNSNRVMGWKGTYSAGTWTWGARSSMISNRQRLSVSSCFDGTISLMVVPNTSSPYEPHVYERDVADTTWTELTGIPTRTGTAATPKVSITYDVDRNPVIFIADSVVRAVEQSTYNRTSSTWTSWTAVSGGTNGYYSGSKIGYWSGTKGSSLDLVWADGSASPWSILYERTAFNVAPSTPTWQAPANGSTQDVASTLLLDWLFNDPDAGDTQSAYTLRRTIGATITYWNGTTWQSAEDATTKIASATESQTLAANWGVTTDADHYYAVKTWDAADAGPSPWSADLQIIPSIAYSRVINTPVGVIDDTSHVLGAARTVANNAGVTDAISWVISIIQANIDVVDVTDATSRVMSAARANIDVADVTDVATAVKTIAVIVTDVVGTTDTVAHVKAIANTVTDVVGTTDTVARVVPFVRIVTDLVAVADQVSDDETNRETLVEIVGVTDTIDRVHVAKRLSTDDVGVVDDILAVKTIQVMVTDNIGVIDDTSRVYGVVRTAIDDIGVTDGVTAVKAIVQTVTDPVDVIDGTALVGLKTATVTEAVGVTDTALRIAPVIRTITDAVGVVDAATQAEGNVEVSVEIVGVVDDTSRVHDAKRIPTDSVGVIDAATSIKTIIVTVTDSVGVADGTVLVGLKTATVIDSVGVTDQVFEIEANIEVVVEAVGAIDTITPAKTIVVVITDAVGVADTVVRVVPFIRSTTDAVGVADTVLDVLSVSEFFETVADIVGVTGNVQTSKAIRIIITDGVGIIDDVQVAKTIPITVTEAVDTTDSTQSIMKYVRSVVDSIDVSDIISRVAPAVRTITETVSVTDPVLSSLSSIGKTRTVTETVSVTDLVTDRKFIFDAIFDQEKGPARDFANGGRVFASNSRIYKED